MNRILDDLTWLSTVRPGASRTAAVTVVGALASAGLCVAPVSAASQPLLETRAVPTTWRTTAASSCGAPETPPSAPASLAVVGNSVFFTADDGVHGRELWKTNRTTGRTALVKDIRPGSVVYDEYSPNELTAVGDSLFFVHDDGVHGRELWRSDGSRAGTVLLKDIVPGSKFSYPTRLTAVGDALAFESGYAVWWSDGTAAGTAPLTGTTAQTSVSRPDQLTAADGLLFFTGEDAEHGSELWVSDGTVAGTHVVDLRPGSASSSPTILGRFGDRVVVSADDGEHGFEPWTSDGTEAGTTLVGDLNPGGYDSSPSYTADAQGTLFFTAVDGVHGREVWSSDGTRDGTAMVKDVQPDPESTNYTVLAAVGGLAFFTADDGEHGLALWRSDGTEAGTFPVTQPGTTPWPGGYLGHATAAGQLFFNGDDGTHGSELWRSDGTPAGTAMVADISPEGAYDQEKSFVTAAGDQVFLSADDGVHGAEVWSSDGTAAGTRMVADVNRGGYFNPGRRATHHPRRGSLTVRVVTEGAGRLRVAPAANALTRIVGVHVLAKGTVAITVRPTALGLRRLRAALRAAHRHHRRVARVAVRERFTFTPCGGPPSSKVRRYVLRLR